MFEQLYDYISNNVNEKNIKDKETIIQEFKFNVENFFSSYFPKYYIYLGNSIGLIEEIAKNTSNNMNEMLHNYNGMISYLNNNVYKWKSYLNVNQLIDSIAECMSVKYIMSLKHSYDITDAVLDTLNANIRKGMTIESKEDLKEKNCYYI